MARSSKLSELQEAYLKCVLEDAQKHDPDYLDALISGGPGEEKLNAYNQKHGTRFISAHNGGADLALHSDEGAQLIIDDLQEHMAYLELSLTRAA